MNKLKLIRQAVHRCKRICDGLYGMDFKPQYLLPRSGEDTIVALRAIIDSLRARPRPTSIDIESMYCLEFGKKSLEPWHPDFHVWCVGISIDDYQAVCIPFDPHPYLMEKFGLCSVTTHPEILLLMHELMQLNCVTHSTYDAFGLAQYGLRFADLDDSLLVAYALEGPEGELSVEDLARIHTEEGGYKSKDYQVAKTKEELEWDKLTFYCCHDADIERRLFLSLKADAIEENVWNGYVKVIKISNMVGVEMTLNGCAMELEKLFTLINAQEAKKAPLVEEFYTIPEVQKSFEYMIAAKETEKRESWRKKFNSITTLRDVKISKTWCIEVLLFDVLKYECTKKTEKGGRSTDEEIIEKLQKKHNNPRILELILEIKGIDKELSTYLTPYVYPKNVDEDDSDRAMQQFLSGDVDRFPYIKADGLIHPQFNQHRARSGRSSSENPNFQNVTNDIDIKSMFVGRIWED